MKKRVLISLFFTAAAAFARFIPLKIPNIEFISTAMVIMTIFFGLRFALPSIIGIVLITDFIKSGPPQVWEVIVILGWAAAAFTQRIFIGKHLSRILTMELAGTVAFFIVTNSLVFFLLNFYPKTLNGYLTCILAGLPFVRNQLIGNSLFFLIAFKTLEYYENNKNSIYSVKELHK